MWCGLSGGKKAVGAPSMEVSKAVDGLWAAWAGGPAGGVVIFTVPSNPSPSVILWEGDQVMVRFEIRKRL